MKKIMLILALCSTLFALPKSFYFVLGSHCITNSNNVRSCSQAVFNKPVLTLDDRKKSVVLVFGDAEYTYYWFRTKYSKMPDGDDIMIRELLDTDTHRSSENYDYTSGSLAISTWGTIISFGKDTYLLFGSANFDLFWPYMNQLDDSSVIYDWNR